jgi:ATP-dependent helicase/nuclease subunit B
VQQTEAPRTLPLVTAAGHALTLIGRLDRIDAREPGPDGSIELAVLDYKSQQAKPLKDRAADAGDHVQLPVYALLAGETCSQTLFVSIDRDGVQSVPAVGDLRADAQAAASRLTAIVDRLHAGAAMPANGIDAVCAHCKVRGLCRRDHWSDPTAVVPSPGVGDD